MVFLVFSFLFFIYLLLYFLNSNIALYKYVSLFFSFILLFFFTHLWLVYDPYFFNFFFFFKMKLLTGNVYFGVDAISLFFCFLTAFLVCSCILFGWDSFSVNRDYFLFLVSMELLLIFFFVSLDFFFFYVFFESILIPLYYYIGLFGSRVRKIHASYLLFIYTLFGSFLMLCSMFIIYFYVGSTSFLFFSHVSFPFSVEAFLWLFLFISFGVKVPIVPFHIWLPEAHVEAPTEGSVLLAGLLLKLGSYGLLRILLPLCSNVSLFLMPIIFIILSFGVVYTSFTTLRQVDIKRIIAYSSVSHMNFCLMGLFSFSLPAVIGSYVIMVGHGFVSSALFFLVGFIYERYKTRFVYYYSGLSDLMPVWSIFFFLFILANISFPGTINFIGEFLVILGVASVSPLFLLFSFVGLILCTCYSLLLYNRICFGFTSSYFYYFSDLNRLEFHLIFPFLVFTLFFGFFPNSLISLVFPYFYVFI